MSIQAVTVHLPEDLDARLKERADRGHRSIEAEVLDVLSVAMPTGDGVPAGIEEELSRLDASDDSTIRDAARSHLTPEEAHRIEELHWKRQGQGLTRDQAQALADLMDQYERTMLIRAHAVALWKRRGHDPSELLASG